MKRSMTTAVISLAMLAAAIHTTLGDETTSPVDPPADINQEITRWGLTFAPIPHVLRSHCRPLRGGHGLLIDQVTAESPAEQRGLRTDDVLLLVDGQPLTSVDELPSPAEIVELAVMREGRVRTLEMIPPMNTRRGVWNQGFLPPQWPLPGSRFPGIPHGPGPMTRGQTAMPRGSGYSPGYATTASATSIAGENQSVSISQAGDQITLEMVDPRLASEPIRFQGTRQQIEQQLQASDLTEDARRQILRTLGRAR